MPDLFSYYPYPTSPGAKTGGASQDSADYFQKSGKKAIWEKKCLSLFQIRPDWTAEEGIDEYEKRMTLDRILIDKCLRPRFSELVLSGRLTKTEERRGNGRIKPQIYRILPQCQDIQDTTKNTRKRKRRKTEI